MRFAIALAAVVSLGVAVPAFAQDNKNATPAEKKETMPAEGVVVHHHRHHHHHHHHPQMEKPEPKPQ